MNIDPIEMQRYFHDHQMLPHIISDFSGIFNGDMIILTIPSLRLQLAIFRPAFIRPNTRGLSSDHKLCVADI